MNLATRRDLAWTYHHSRSSTTRPLQWDCPNRFCLLWPWHIFQLPSIWRCPRQALLFFPGACTVSNNINLRPLPAGSENTALTPTVYFLIRTTSSLPDQSSAYGISPNLNDLSAALHSVPRKRVHTAAKRRIGCLLTDLAGLDVILSRPCWSYFFIWRHADHFVELPLRGKLNGCFKHTVGLRHFGNSLRSARRQPLSQKKEETRSFSAS